MGVPVASGMRSTILGLLLVENENGSRVGRQVQSAGAGQTGESGATGG